MTTKKELENKLNKLSEKVDKLNDDLLKLHGQFELIIPAVLAKYEPLKTQKPTPQSPVVLPPASITLPTTSAYVTPKVETPVVTCKPKRTQPRKKQVKNARTFPSYIATKEGMQKLYGSGKTFKYNVNELAHQLQNGGYVLNYSLGTIAWCLSAMKNNGDIELVHNTSDPFHPIMQVK